MKQRMQQQWERCSGRLGCLARSARAVFYRLLPAAYLLALAWFSVPPVASRSDSRRET